MALIIILILLGMFLLGVELFLLPGITIAGAGALLACGFGVYEAFSLYGNSGGFIALGSVLLLSVALLIIGLRSKTWKKLALHNNIDGRSQSLPADDEIRIGDCGTAVTRLAPMGKVMINGRTYEAKSVDVYIDQRSRVEVTGFDNFNIVVKAVKDTDAARLNTDN